MPYDSGADWRVEVVESDADFQAEIVGTVEPVNIDRDGVYFFEDFTGNILLNEFVIPLANSVDNSAQVPVDDTSTTTCLFRVPRCGKLTGIAVVGATTLATNNTNYVTFSATNKLRSGAGSVALLAASDANTTKTTGGSAWTNFISRSLTLTSTDADLVVGFADVLQITITVAGTLANTVDRPTVRIQLQEIPSNTRGVFTAATADKSPYIVPVANSLIGEVRLQSQETITSANIARISWNTSQFVNASNGARFRCRLKVSAATANQNMAWGLTGGADQATLDAYITNAWFRLEGASLAVVVESDDAANDDDDNATGFTMVADTYYIFEVDMGDLAAVAFRIYDDDGVQQGNTVELSMAGLAADTGVQPFVGHFKASGTQTDSITVDWWEVSTTSR